MHFLCVKLLQPHMVDLTRGIVLPSFTFKQCGLDCCEPFYIKDELRQLEKVKVAIFICFSTKAVHTKSGMFLTKEGCLAALELFKALLGMPVEVYSDNSTSFIGTNGEQELRPALATKKFQHLKSVFSYENSITWLTIPLGHQNLEDIVNQHSSQGNFICIAAIEERS